MDSDFSLGGTYQRQRTPRRTSVPEIRVKSDENGIPIPYLGKADFILAIQAAGRLQDLADIEEIGRANS